VARRSGAKGGPEPDAGSDLAGIRSRARRDEAAGGWLLSGQKTWVLARRLRRVVLRLFRSDPTPSAMRPHLLPGPPRLARVTVRPIPQLDGETGFAEIFFDEVFVPDTQVLGGVGEGWKVAMATAGSERGLSLRSPAATPSGAGRLLDLFAATRAAPRGRPARWSPGRRGAKS